MARSEGDKKINKLQKEQMVENCFSTFEDVEC